MDMRIERVLESAKPFYNNGDPSHDFSHIHRVLHTCRVLGKSEDADLNILLPAAILHDIVNVPKNSDKRSKASELAAEKASKILKSCDYSDDEVDKIYNVILEHSFSLGKKPSSIESAILQDADKLDALGAIGIMRMVTCGTRMGASYYHEADPFAQSRELDDKTYSLDHFERKLFKLPEMMNTESARIEANKRRDVMKTFLQSLQDEIYSSNK
jgi:uncharacterized protein